jgi:hypothetical protein
VIGAPPFEAGGEKVTTLWPLPAVAEMIVGAPGAEALTVKDWLTCGAAAYAEFPAWFALMVQVPVATKVNVPPLVTVQTPVVAEVKTTARPELAVAESVGLELKLCAPGLAKVMVCVD